MESQLLQGFIEKHKLPEAYLTSALKWFVPLADLIISHQKGAQGAFFLGLNGSQGSGKSTLTDFIKTYCEQEYDLTVAVLSLDDFYLNQNARAKLAQDIHPLLQTRGVPGTHDVDLMTKVLSLLKLGETGFTLPRFNKATDNPFPKEQWPLVEGAVDLVIFEGWCWGTSAQTQQELQHAVNSLEQNEDNKGTWRTFVNTALSQDYLPLYSFIDFWILLKAPSFDCVFEWRKQQEHKLLASQPEDTSGLMSDAEIHRFIQHYQRLTEQTLLHSERQFDIVYRLDRQRQIVSVTGLDIT